MALKGMAQEATATVIAYPSPATVQVTFELKKDAPKNCTILISNFAGKRMSEIKNVSGKSTLNLAQYSRGVYIYTVLDNSNGKQVATGKFAVSK